WPAFHDEYVRLRGHPFATPSVLPLYTGSFRASARATLTARPAPPEPRNALVRRYVELLKKALLNETALEAEAAFYLARDASRGSASYADAVAYDVRARAPGYVERVERARAEGRYVDEGDIGFAHTMIGRARLDHLDACVSTVIAERVP